MKRLLTVLSLLVLISSCAPKIIPVQGTYPELPMTFKSDKPVNEVWDKLIDLFAQKGLSIKLIDKSSGLIISENSPVTATWEDKNLKPYHPDAYIVVPRIYNTAADQKIAITKSATNKSSLKKPDVLRGEWNVRIKQLDSGTSINVNLVNVQYEVYEYRQSVRLTNLSSFRSTGKFEQLIADAIK